MAYHGALMLAPAVATELSRDSGTDMAPPGLRGPFIGVFQTIIEAGTLCGPLILGLVLQWSGDPRIGTVLCAVAGLVAAAAFFIGKAYLESTQKLGA